MLEALKFVQGAVAKKDFVPELVHFHIEGGTVRGYNGMIGLCCPIDLSLDIRPKATAFVKAIQTCKDTIQLHVTPAGRLSVKSGSFKAFVDCTQEAYPEVVPEGPLIDLSAGGMLAALKTLEPYIAEDASRPWARGILFRGQSAFATNNIILAEYWLGYDVPVEINIPKAAVVELLRINEEPVSMQLTDTSVTFHFEGQRWLRSQTYSTDWPDITRILSQESTPVPFPDKFWEAVEDLAPFTDELGRVFFSDETVATHTADGIGAAIEVPGLAADGCYNYKHLFSLQGVAKQIDFSSYPKPCLFFGDKLRGAIIGMRY